MVKYIKMSADEAQTKRKDHLAKVGAVDNAIVKAAKAPPSWNKDGRSARFVMSTQGVDRYGDIIVTDGIKTVDFERNPVGLLFHASRSWPVGSWEELTKELNRRPPRLEGTLAILPEGGPVKEVDEAAWMIANGGIRACSIGFDPDWDQVEGITDDEGFWTGLKFNVSDLLECSVCSVPANAQALVKSADGDPRLARELLEDVLDNWVRTPEGLLLERADFEKAYKVVVEKIAEATPAPAPEPAVGDPTEEEITAFVIKVVETGASIEEKGSLMTARAKGAVVAELDLPVLTPDSVTGIKVNERIAAAKAALNATAAVEPTAEVIDAFVALAAGAEIKLWVGDELRIAANLADKEVSQLVMPDTMSIGKAIELRDLIAKRVKEPIAEPEKTAPVGTISIDLDITEATEKISVFQKLVDSVEKSLIRVGILRAAPVAEERQEPVIVEPAAPPPPEVVAAARSAAAETLARLESAGRL